MEGSGTLKYYLGMQKNLTRNMESQGELMFLNQGENWRKLNYMKQQIIEV